MLCLSCTEGIGPSALVTDSHSLAPLVRSIAVTRNVMPSAVAAAPAAAPAPNDRSPAAAASAPCASRGPCRDAPLPTCDVTKTRSPHTMGEDTARPRMADFQAMPSVLLQRLGNPVSGETPDQEGPRQCGQLSACTPTAAAAISTGRSFRNRMG